jgi:eukaryotic-like serine/threonine-protein kinase
VIAANLVGTTLGDYAIEALLGSGGMATVYRGLDRHLQRPVAIKILAAHTAALPGFVARFRREARLIANLRHPNIVQIYTFGEEQGLIYMVQELLPGPTLEQRIAEARRRRQTLPNEEVTTIISQLAAALTAAHKAGVIHRDVKPANALWNTVGALVLTDFGIAKETAATVTQTESGQVIGTPAYMSPEQGQGLALTPATDIYSLGVILFELLTNQVPFTASTPVAVVLQHIHDQPPSLRALRPDLPPAVEAVVQQALAKDPAQRFRSADALATALQQAWVLANVPMHQLPTQAWNPPARPAANAATYALPWPAPAPCVHCRSHCRPA